MKNKQKLSDQDKQFIVATGKDFADGFKPDIESINGSAWLIVDPLSAFLATMGFPNTLHQLPENDDRPQILIMEFEDGSQLIPAAGDLKYKFPEIENWQWL